MHLSNILQGQSLLRTFLSSTEFGCPLCPKFKTTTEIVIQAHLRNHRIDSVQFQDKLICRCNHSCRDGSHFHCPICSKTIRHKHQMIFHVVGCPRACDMLQPTFVPPLIKTEPSSPHEIQSLTLSASFAPEDSPAGLVSVEHSYTLPASTSEPVQSHSPLPQQVVTAEAQTHRATRMPPSRVKCPHCSIDIFKKNLVLHIERKHRGPRDITAEYHLKSVCVQPSRGLYAVQKSICGFSVPVHVQRKTWGPQHVTKCEIMKCQQNHLLAVQSDPSHRLCQHIRSLDYCEATATEEPLQHKVLEEMLENKFFDQSDVVVCKERQKEAQEAHMPLSVLVELGSQTYICLSIHEPELSRFNALGRVMVSYNIKSNALHCHCTKTQTSCPHKYISMWHLFQTHRELLLSAPPTTTTSPVESDSVSHPPTAEERTTPAALHEDVTAPTALTDVFHLPPVYSS